MTEYLVKVRWAVALIMCLGVVAESATITLDYNGFNPGTTVTVWNRTTGSYGSPVATLAAAVAGDTEGRAGAGASVPLRAGTAAG